MVKTQCMQAVFLCAMIFVLAAAPAAFAQDFGMILGQSVRLDSASNVNVESTTSAVPWFSTPLGTRAEFYISAGLFVEYPAEGWSPVDGVRLLPELFRTELAFALSDTMGLSLGRINFRCGQALVMSGLFDGASFFVDSRFGRFNAGVFYTGGLYKGTASINISPHDNEITSDDDRYHASRRLAGGITWEQTGVFDTRNTLRLSGLFQVDLNDADVKVHSQYLVAGASIPVGWRSLAFNIDAGAVFSLSQVVSNSANTELRLALAASLDLRWTHTGTMPGMVTVGGRFASGEAGGMGAFVPVTGRSLGSVLQPDFSGAAMARIGYDVRLTRTLFAEVSAGYFFRTDSVTFVDGIEYDSPFLGGEFFASLSWAPFSDMVFTLGGGVFLPGMGGAFASGENIRYRLELTAGISL